LVVALMTSLGLSGCGADGQRTALAIRSTSWDDEGRLVLQFECAEVDSVDVEPGAGEAGIPLVTAWGEPTLGRCAPEVAVSVAAGVDRIDDATTGMVVDLAPRSPRTQ